MPRSIFALVVMLVAMVTTLRAAVATAAPLFESEFGVTVLGSCSMAGAPSAGTGSAMSATSFSLLRRWPLGRGWYVGAGATADDVFFHSSDSRPEALRDLAAEFSLEYFIGGESVAGVSLRPGYYFERHPTSQAWDVPVEFTTGVPLGGAWSGVVGFENGRFYHHAVPVLGLVWTGRSMRIEAVYPEPAIVWTINPRVNLRVGGELAGGGYLADRKPIATPVEYSSYRGGVTATWKMSASFEFSATAGAELERSFDYFRLHQRVHGDGAAYGKLRVSWKK